MAPLRFSWLRRRSTLLPSPLPCQVHLVPLVEVAGFVLDPGGEMEVLLVLAGVDENGIELHRAGVEAEHGAVEGKD